MQVVPDNREIQIEAKGGRQNVSLRLVAYKPHRKIPVEGNYRNHPVREWLLRNITIARVASPRRPHGLQRISDKTTYTLSTPGILEEMAVIHRDGSGKPISTVTAMDAWSNSEHYADNEVFHYNDSELHKRWDHSGAYANLKYFHLTRKMYDQKEMLGQYGDFTGHWTPEQFALIYKKGLKE